MMSKFFLNRPVFSIVISIIIVLLGIVSLKQLAVEQFPTLSPVQVLVATKFPGASAETMADCVAAPLEQAINGIQDMIYMYSQSVAPGILNLIVSFEIGTDPNTALTNTQNAVNLALSSLPMEVQKQGVVVANQYPSILLFISLESKNNAYNNIFLSNYASTNIADQLNRLYGVSQAQVLNARDYSMRIWLKPDRLAQLDLTPADVIAAIQEQNGIRSIGLIGGEPVVAPNQLTLPVNAKGRLKDPQEFEEIVIRAEKDGAMVLLKDVCRVELGAQNYDLIGNLNGKTGAFIGIYQDVGTNAIEVSKGIRAKMDELSQFFPEGVTYTIPYDTTNYIRISIHEVEKTLIEAAILVSIVILVFLHSFRVSLVPIVAMIVSIVGTFSGMYMLGFSINTLTLFGLVLAVGIVVDDAIIVVENIERHMREDQLPAKEAAMKAMKEVTGPVIATAIVLGSVFIPVSFLGGIPGQFYKQFAITISFSVFLSGFIALTLSPVLAVLLLQKPIKQRKIGEWFNVHFQKLTNGYLKGAKWVLENPLFSTLFCLLMLVCIWGLARVVPIGFVPAEDQGLILVTSELPDGASISRVDQVSNQVEQLVMNNPDVSDILSFSGYSILESIPRTSNGAYFLNLKNWDQRKHKAPQIIDTLNEKLSKIPEANIVAFNPPDIPGIGVVGGFDFWIVNERDISYSQLNAIVDKIIAKAEKNPMFYKLLTSIKANSMELFITLDLAKARSYGVKVDQIYQTLQALLGSIYVNQFNKFGHVYQVVAQAEPAARRTIEDIGDVYVKSSHNEMIPLKSLIIPKFSKAPTLVQRFNNTPAALISVIPAIPDSEKIMATMEEIAREFIVPGVTYSWGGLAFEEKKSGGVHNIAFLASLILVFLVLSALYERWSLPIAILMTIPFGVFGAFLAVWISHGVANIYFQIGIIALIGLSAKNAILIVEFAKEERKAGKDIQESALEAARLRFRAIMMTSLTMIMGALPLVITSGAGAMSRKSVGTGIIGGVAMATFLAVFFVPLFYKAMERLSERRKG
ncbi:MAG: efflux RND transporter permease subunit [Parachlamydiales bacterium]|nr:efflux RND transporter permease subunit [Parachlamydiales bacterium]